MAKSNLTSLIGKLNDVCRSTLERSAGFCLAQTHYEVDLEHFFVKLLDAQNTDLHKILRHFEINESRLRGELSRVLDGFKTGNARTPALSPRIPRMIQDAWLVASIDYQSPAVRSGHMLIGVLSNDETARMFLNSAGSLSKISLETLSRSIGDITAGSAEEKGGGGGQEAGAAPAAGKRALEQFTVNLTEKARKGEIDPVLGRDFEVRQMADILIRRRQNNPILTGEAGVGKTAVVEGFALKIVLGEVPPPLRGVEVRALDLGLLQAGAGIKGEFENRLKSVIAEIASSPVPIILFIDEAHTLIGAGGAAGTSDAANLLKPALARGELRTIAATTWGEYKKYFEKDPALTRRFQVVKVEEPDEEKAIMMMRAIAPFLEKHHRIMITDQALIDSVRLSHRYLPARQLPDKSVSVLDTACARVAIGLTTPPPVVEDLTRRIQTLEREIRILEREAVIGYHHEERLAKLCLEKKDLLIRLAEITATWVREKELAGTVGALRLELQAVYDQDPAAPAVALRREDLKKSEAELAALQGNNPLVQIAVTPQIISEVISGWTGIPTGRMLADEIRTVLTLEKQLGERIIGQDHALAAIGQRIRTAHAGIEDPSKPTAVFMFAGPSGVGKTETALALSELLYGGDDNVITINMSEYKEAHSVSLLKGSPPGYVGYGEGGVLTEAVRKRPYSVLLLDEVEKAHPDVMEIFFQVFDKGTLEDGEGRRIDFRNTLIILTSNLGTELIGKLCADEETRPSWQSLSQMLHPELMKQFKPAFLGRLKIVPYYPITDSSMRLIVKLKLERIARRMLENRNVIFSYHEAIVDSVARRCTEVESGARNADQILSNTLLPEMSNELLSRMAAGETIREVKVSLDGDAFLFEVL